MTNKTRTDAGNRRFTTTKRKEKSTYTNKKIIHRKGNRKLQFYIPNHTKLYKPIKV